MDLSFSDEQVMLKDMVSRLCREQAPLTALRQLEGSEPGYSFEFWSQLASLGVTGLTISGTYEGLGLGALESVLVAEEFGRTLAVSPFHSSAVLAAGLISRCGNSLQKTKFLPSLARGEKIVAVASEEFGVDSCRQSMRVTTRRKGGHYILAGTKHYVAYAASADAVIVLARLCDTPDAIIGLCIDKSCLADDRLSYLPNHAGEPLYKVALDDLAVPEASVLNEGTCLWTSWENVMSLGSIHMAAYAAGAAQQIQAITVDYAKYRRAFGRAIGGFQAIAHYLADVEVLIEGARTLTYQAAWAHDNGKPFEQLAAMAKLQACDVFCRAASVAIQVHGGIGYTLEADPQLYFRKAKHLEQMYWGPDFLERRIAGGVF